MNEPLFRPEVVDANKSKMIGTVAIYSPPWRWLMISVVAVLALSVAVFLFLVAIPNVRMRRASCCPQEA